MSLDSSKNLTQINPLNIKHLNLKHSAKEVMMKNEVIDFIVKEIQKIPGYGDLRNNLELIRYVCNIIENLIVNNNEKIDKKESVVSIICQLFSIFNDDEK